MLIRMQFRKTRAGRFLSHLDLMHTWERVIRRSGLPLGFTQGFNPHPKMNFASALAVGTTSDAEYMDLDFNEDLTLEQVREALFPAVPPAFEIVDMKIVTDKKVPSLMSIIQRATYTLRLEYVAEVTQAELDQAVEAFWNMEENIIYRYKKDSKDKKAVNIRPGVYSIVLNREENTDDKHAVLDIVVQSGNDGNIRPEEVAYGLMNAGMPLVQQVVRIHRTGLYALDENDNMITPLQAVK